MIFKLMVIIVLLIGALSSSSIGQIKTIHVYVALCDNEHQGIVPVQSFLGNGKDPGNNLYWGAAFGVKTYFTQKTSDWELISVLNTENTDILDRLLYKHATKDIYMLADAYDGEKIKVCIEDFLKSSNGQLPISLTHDSLVIEFGGHADLVAYVGHDGLMEWNVNIDYNDTVNEIHEKIWDRQIIVDTTVSEL